MFGRLHSGRAAAIALVLVVTPVTVACGPGSAPMTGTGEGTTGMPGMSSTGHASVATSSTSGTTSTGTTAATSSGTSSGAGDSAGFLAKQDLGEGIPCNPYIQDCPPGNKCTIDWLGIDPVRKCVPIDAAPAQLDELCMVEGTLGSGIDNCDKGFFCWDYDTKGHGKCWAFCQGDPTMGQEATCPDGMYCETTAESVLNACIRPCDPLLQDCPAPGDVCIPPSCYKPGDGCEFTCWLKHLEGVRTGEAGSPCHLSSHCNEGLVCLVAEASMDCTDTVCCQPICDTTAPNTCPGPGQECVPWFPDGWAPPGQDNVGVCALPP